MATIVNDPNYKESGIDKAATLINAIGGLVNGGGKGRGIPSFDKGGVAPKRELAIVDKGETMIPKDKMDSNEPKHSLYRAIHGIHKGRLHRALGVPEGEKIPTAKLKAAKNSKNPTVSHMAHFAETLKHLNH